ncbi:MAG: TRAP transporter substrate-binding protein [Spirochaetes bacterium]|nr:TRAP transporter substrate-binding protein [Spirochaetota bacterium]
MNRVKAIRINIFIIFIVIFGVINDLRAELINLVFSSAVTEDHVIHKNVLKPWAEKLNKITDNRVKIRIYPAGFMGPVSEQYNLVKNANADLSYAFHDYAPGEFPMTTVFELPYMVPGAHITSRTMWQFYDKYHEFRKEYDKVLLLALFCTPGSHFHTLLNPVNTVSDIKGLKIITTNPYASDALRILGAVPVFIPIDKTYNALEKGQADGILLHWEGLVEYKLHNLIKFTTLAYFSTTTMMISMSKSKYSSLPPDIQRVFDTTTGEEMSSLAGKVFDSVEEQSEKTAVVKGIKVRSFSNSDMKKLHSLIYPLREQWLRKIAKKGISADNLLQDILLIESMARLRYITPQE